MNIIIKQGSTKKIDFKHFTDAALTVAKDLTSCTANCWFGYDLDTPISSLKFSLGSGLTLSSNNTISAVIPAANTTNIIFDGSTLSGVYNLEVTLSGETYRTYEGTFTLQKELIH
jgi:hypothetical protein